MKAVRITALKIVGLYALLGFAWLAAFDEAMDALNLRELEPYTDLIFLVVSSAIFYFVLVRYMDSHDQDQRALERQRGLADQAQMEQEHNVALRNLNAELGRSNAELEQFAYVASHDLRQPLRMVSSYLSLTERRLHDVLDEDTRQYMAFARDGAHRMDHLIIALLEYSRVGRGGDVPESVDLGAVVAEVIVTMGMDLEDLGGHIVVNGTLPTIMANPLEMVQLFQNVLTNAIKYRHPERAPLVTVSARWIGGLWEIAIADNGIGIAPENCERIFRVFQRLHDRKIFEGTGIGLAIVKKVVDRHGGHIMVRSIPGEGSEFVITLPVEASRSVLGAGHLLSA